MKKVLSFLLCLIFVFVYCGTVGFASDADKTVELSVTFDKEEYCVGEKAVASVKLVGISDEAEAGLSLGSLSVHLFFDGLSYITSGSELGVTASKNETTNDIVLIYDSLAGTALPAESNEIEVAVIEFTVEDNLENNVFIRFRDESITGYEEADDSFSSIVLGQYDGANSTIADVTWACTYGSAKSDSAPIVKAIFSKSENASYISNKVSQTVSLRWGEDIANPILIAKLYDESTDLMITAPYIYKYTDADNHNKVIDVVFTGVAEYSQNLKVKYFLWDGFIGIRPLMRAIESSVVAE